MSIPDDTAREAARNGDGRFGTQPAREVGIELVAPGPQPALDLSGFLPVDDEVRTRVTRMTRMLGAHDDDAWDRRRDRVDAIVLTRVLPGIVASLDVADGELDVHGLDAFEERLLEKSFARAKGRLDRAAREVVGKVWEATRMRRGTDKLMSDKYDRAAAWSPEALRVILDDDGTPKTGSPWSGRLELEHVVPASTVAKIVTAMTESGKGADDVAAALRDCIHHVVVKKDQKDDQPRASTMNDDLERVLIDHYAGGPELDEDELFQVTWSRYLDPSQRDGDDRSLSWELHQLRTVHGTLGKPVDAR